MFELLFSKFAERVLEDLEFRNKASFRKITEALDSLEEKGIESSNVKKLKNTRGIFRKRAGRFRILFTTEGKKIKVWIIAIEKDSNKDYPRWISHISG